MKLLIVLLTGLVTVLASTYEYTNVQHRETSSLNRQQCRWMNGEYKCESQTCIVSSDGKRRCTTRQGPEIIANSQNEQRASRYQCRWINGQLKCMYQYCTLSVDGRQNCTFREGPPPTGIYQERFSAHSTKTNCEWVIDKMICTKEHCTIYPNGEKSCSSTMS